MLGSSIDAITGGTFYVPGQLPYSNPNLRAAFLVFRNPSATESGFGQIRIGTISGGTFSGPIGLMLSNGESTHLENDTVIDSITGGTFVAGASDNPLRDRAMGYGLYSTAHNTISSISDGTFTGQTYGAWNSGTIGSISNGTFAGQFDGLLNDGVIGEISDGDFTGGDYGLSQASGTTTHIGKITGGHYTATGLNLPMHGSAIKLAKPTPVEPDLVTEIGNARFKGVPERSDDGQGAFEGLANTVFSGPYHVSRAVDADGYHYLVVEVTLTYDPNGGAGMTIDYPRERHSTYVVSNNLFTRDGFRFVGWNTRADGTGGSYAPGDFLTLNPDSPTLTLYAQWVDESATPSVTPGGPQSPAAQTQTPMMQTSVEALQEQAYPQHAVNATPQTGDHVQGMAVGAIAVAVALLIGMVMARRRHRNG